jgi:hypothetical protein
MKKAKHIIELQQQCHISFFYNFKTTIDNTTNKHSISIYIEQSTTLAFIIKFNLDI